MNLLIQVRSSRVRDGKVLTGDVAIRPCFSEASISLHHLIPLGSAWEVYRTFARRVNEPTIDGNDQWQQRMMIGRWSPFSWVVSLAGSGYIPHERPGMWAR
ncbi:MAG: hypothetical protein J7M25_02750 [Deltaproteobacteria bacterium]|nr:hypothetical protein [Deltaproteobacteria bacterium]